MSWAGGAAAPCWPWLVLPPWPKPPSASPFPPPSPLSRPFLAAANARDACPEPLLDRMELVALDGYTEDEKVTIARDHLVPRQLDRAGLDSVDVTIEDGALRRIAAEYTREAGVRALERSLARTLRKIAARLAVGETTRPVTVGPSDLVDYLQRH